MVDGARMIGRTWFPLTVNALKQSTLTQRLTERVRTVAVPKQFLFPLLALSLIFLTKTVC